MVFNATELLNIYWAKVTVVFQEPVFSGSITHNSVSYYALVHVFKSLFMTKALCACLMKV